MKKSVQIHRDIEDLLLQHLQKHKEASFNSVVNDALEVYLKAIVLDSAEMRKRENYKLIVIRLHTAVVELLQALRKNFNVKAVCEAVSFFLLQEFNKQQGRLKWPDRAYCGAEYINKLASKILKRLGIRGNREV